MEHRVRFEIAVIDFDRHAVSIHVAGQCRGGDRLAQGQPHQLLRVVMSGPLRRHRHDQSFDPLEPAL